MGNQFEALEHLQKGLELAKKGENFLLVAMANYYFGEFYSEYDPQMAKEYYLKVLNYFKDHVHTNFSDLHFYNVYMSVAHTSCIAKDFGSALKYLQEAENIPGINEAVLDEIALKKAEVLLQMKRTKDAEIIIDKEYKHSSSNIVTFPRVMARLLLETGRYEEAHNYIMGIMPLMHRSLARKPALVEHYIRHGWYHEGMGNKKDAIIYFIDAIKLLEVMRKQFPEGIRLGFFRKDIHSFPYRHLTSILAEFPMESLTEQKELKEYGKTNFEAALYFAEATKARIFLEYISILGRSRAGQISSKLKSKESYLLKRIQDADKALQKAAMEEGFQSGKFIQKNGGLAWKTPDAPKAFIDAYNLWESAQIEWAHFEDELYRTYPRYAVINYPRPMPLDEIPLTENEVVLEYAIGEKMSHLFLIQASKKREIIRINAGKDEIENLIGNFLKPIHITRSAPNMNSGEKLYELLLSKALSNIPRDKRVIIVPDGSLGTLPFGILPIKSSREITEVIYVQDRWSIVYYPSLSVLALNRLTLADNTKRPFFGIGNPIFVNQVIGEQKPKALSFTLRRISNEPKYVFPPLPETETEIIEAAKLLGVVPAPPDVLLQNNATKTNLKKTKLKFYKIIHFATHGIANNDIVNINEPALILSQLDSENDGILKASEVQTLDLGSSLVILSACKTGLGEEVGGEGIMSMARAFQLAGAKSVIMSLWEVPSVATVQLFLQFYKNLSNGQKISKSLQLAKDEVRKKFPDSFYWGAFVMIGED